MSTRHTVGLAVLGPWACRNARIWNCWQASKGQFCSKVCRTWAFFGVSRQNKRGKIKCWMANQHLVLWHGFCRTPKQAGELISRPDLATRALDRVFHRTKSKVCSCKDKFYVITNLLDRLCGLVVRVSGDRYKGLGFDSRRYQIFWVAVGLERGALSLVRSIEELLE